MNTQYPLLFLLTCLLLLPGRNNAQDKYNLDFEILDTTHQPSGWIIPALSAQKEYRIRLDSAIVRQGKYAVSIEKIAAGDTHYSAFNTSVAPPARGLMFHLTGYLKTQDVANGFAGLYVKMQDKSGNTIAFDNMNAQGLTGTTPWTEYSIALPLNKSVDKITIGALLAGDGKVWVDNLHVFVDNKPLADVPVKTPAPWDSLAPAAMAKASTALTQDYTPARLTQLADFSRIWSFLKYYHPAVARGDYDMDSVLITLVPALIASSPQTACLIEERLVDDLGPVPACSNCHPDPADKVKETADYGDLFAPGHLPSGLVQKLAFIRDNHPSDSLSYYVRINQLGGAEMQNETDYGNAPCPTAIVRLIAAFRYWGIIQYHYPYRYLIRDDWNTALPECLPDFINAADRKEYIGACLRLIGHIHDSHAGVWTRDQDSLRGPWLIPLAAKFVEGKLLVAGYYDEKNTGLRTAIRPGDIIEKIDGVPVDDLVKRYWPLTPGSNDDARYRDLARPEGWLLRSNDSTARLTVLHYGTQKLVGVERIRTKNRNFPFTDIDSMPAYKFAAPGIGYINPGKLTEKALDTVRILFDSTRALIIDLRCYPHFFMPFALGSWLKATPSPFALFTNNSLHTPGAFLYSKPISNGGPQNGQSGGPTYRGKIVILVDFYTQSQAEYTAMALQSVPGALVIGSRTAGADGNVVSFVLPGGVYTGFSSIGVYYPGKRETQQIGVRIDVPVHQTIAAIREGRDEYLETALNLLK